MAMGKRVAEGQESFWIATADLPPAPGHPFYERLNKILHGDDFDRFVESRCRKFYAAKMGRPSLAPAVYFRLLLIGYFEGIDIPRGARGRDGKPHALRFENAIWRPLALARQYRQVHAGVARRDVFNPANRFHADILGERRASILIVVSWQWSVVSS